MSQTRARGRTPSFVFGGTSLLVLVLILTALSPSQPPPPPTPEYAPEAVQALRDPPREQTSSSGTGPLGDAGGADGPGDGPGGSDEIIEQNRVRSCVGDPPRQIEDPQSPPCVAYWEGDNGGETWKGVTADEIRVAVPAAENARVLQLLITFFNRRFEFYGRRIVPVFPGCGGHTPSDMQRCAKSVDSQNVFASTSYSDVGGNQNYYYDALAERGIISVGSHPDRRTEADFARHAPHQWSYLPSFDKVGRHLGSFVCQQLAGRTAAHAGGDLITRERAFGLVYNTYPDAPAADVRALRATLASCGAPPLERTVEYQHQGHAYQQETEKTQQESVSAIASFRTQDVTTVLCVCHTSTVKQVTRAAQSVGYEPEWIVSSYAYADDNVFWSLLPQSQAAHTMGLTFWNKRLAPANMTWYWATQDVDPTFDYEGNPFVYFAAHYLYHQLLVLASGIQMAGPTLTPQTFQDGMWNTEFPNPTSRYYPGTVGFEDRDHTFVNDGAIIWWDPAGRDPWVATQGSFCYVRRGARNLIGRYPERDEPFSPRICDRSNR